MDTEELQEFCSPLNTIKVMEYKRVTLEKQATHRRNTKNANIGSVVKPQKKKSRRLKRITIGWEDVDSFRLLRIGSNDRVFRIR